MESPTPPSRSPVTGGDDPHLPPASADHSDDLVAGLDNLSLSQERSPSLSPMGRQVPLTRTVAIIKNHALQHRFDIEPRIQEASFEIVKERQMEFDTETDPDALYELFGEDTDSLAEGPVWVYVLERKRAVEVWNTLMGDRHPEIARLQSPNSLRALYGISLQQNAVMGSPDTQTAEIQIAALFASSPPFRSSDLPADTDIGDRYGSIRSLSSVALEALRAEQSEAGYAASSVTNASTVTGSNGGKPSFKARPVPVTNAQPDIVPRMTRAAALRINGVSGDKSPNRPRAPLTKERLAETFANVPGHKRTSTIVVASTAPPVVAPRMTKAASLRIAKEAATNGTGPGSPALKKRAVTDSPATPPRKSTNTFEGVPGHKRRETISVASVKPPTVTPRLNKSSALRALPKEGTQTSPSSFRGSLSPPVSRTVSSESTTPARRQSLAPTRTLSRAPVASTPTRRSLSALDVHADPKLPSTENGTPSGVSRPPSAAAKPRPRPSSVMMGPSITPRTNKSAALRAAKMEAEAAAAAAAAAKKKSPRGAKPPPSSFKSNVVAT